MQVYNNSHSKNGHGDRCFLSDHDVIKPSRDLQLDKDVLKGARGAADLKINTSAPLSLSDYII